MLDDQKEQILLDLGLTELQTAVYLALLQCRNPTATVISKITKIARQEVYRITDELEEGGIAFRTLSSPVEFQPVPLDEALAILMERRIQKTANLVKKVRAVDKTVKTQSECVQNFFIKMSDSPQDFFGTFPLSLDSVKAFDLLTSYDRWAPRYKHSQKSLTKILGEQGIRIRILVDKPPIRKPDRIIDYFRASSNFQIRFIDAKPEVIVGVLDGKEALISVLKERPKTPFLHSNHPYFVYLAKASFEFAWQRASLEYY